MFKNYWIMNRKFDLLFILLPSFISVILGVVFYTCFQDFFNQKEVNLIFWVVMVLFIDVGHVYSTLFRTYLDSDEYQEFKVLLTLLPLALWVFGVFLYQLGAIIFWRVIAYIAVYHFIRQQYGFLSLYSKFETSTKFLRNFDKFVIYLVCLCPLLIWHLNLPREFSWFVADDFIKVQNFFSFNNGRIILIIKNVFAGILILYFFKEGYFAFKNKIVNSNKNLIVIGTALSWYIGIVSFNSDIVFTVTNVLSHGIPYIALVYAFGIKSSQKNPHKKLFLKINYSSLFSKKGFAIFFLTLFILGYVEEGLWDVFVWREHLNFFSIFSFIPKLDDKELLSFIVPLLILPQVTHYLLDGFIWKIHKKNQNWQKYFQV